MANLKEEAQAHEPKKTLNIADLDMVDLSWPIEERSGEATKTNADGKDYEETYHYKVMIVGGLEYRVPDTVFEEIKKMLKLVPEMQFVKVTKTGAGKQTRYSVEKMDKEINEEKDIDSVANSVQ